MTTVTMTIDFTPWLNDQNAVYSKRFLEAGSTPKTPEAQTLEAAFNDVGVVPAPVIANGQGGYLIMLRHPQIITDKLAEFTHVLASQFPIIPYDGKNAHTTFSDYGLVETKDGKAFELSEETLDRLALAVSNIDLFSFNTPIIRFDSWLYNQNSVIVSAEPIDDAFTRVATAIIGSAKNEGLELRAPWGSHMTAARFTQPIAGKDLHNFKKLMSEAPYLGYSVGQYVDVGYFTLGPQGFDVTSVDRYNC